MHRKEETEPRCLESDAIGFERQILKAVIHCVFMAVCEVCAKKVRHIEHISGSNTMIHAKFLVVAAISRITASKCERTQRSTARN